MSRHVLKTILNDKPAAKSIRINLGGCSFAIDLTEELEVGDEIKIVLEITPARKKVPDA